LLRLHRKTPDDGQRNYPKHVEFYSENKFEKLMHIVGFIIRIYHDAWSPERQTNFTQLICKNIPLFTAARYVLSLFTEAIAKVNCYKNIK